MSANFESLQFVAYLKNPSAFSALELWQNTFGSNPANFNSVQNGTQASSPWLGDNLIIQVSPQRIDVVVAPPAPVSMPNSLPSISAPRDKIDLAVDLLKKLTASEDVFRPATVWQTFDVAISNRDAQAKLIKIIPCPTVPDAEEVDYHTTFAKQSRSIPGFSVRRIIKWGVSRRSFLEVQPSGMAVGNAPTFWGVASMVDVYVEPPAGINHAQFGSLLDDLVTEAQEILSRGYDAIR